MKTRKYIDIIAIANKKSNVFNDENDEGNDEIVYNINEDIIIEENND